MGLKHGFDTVDPAADPRAHAQWSAFHRAGGNAPLMGTSGQVAFPPSRSAEFAAGHGYVQPAHIGADYYNDEDAAWGDSEGNLHPVAESESVAPGASGARGKSVRSRKG